MTEIQRRIIKSLYGAGESMRTDELVRGSAEDTRAALVSLERMELIYNYGDELAERDDPEFEDVWQLTVDGIRSAEAMGCY